MWSIYLQSLAGGALIGLAAALYLLADGRIAGAVGIFAGALRGQSPGFWRNLAFVAGLILGPVLYRAVFGAFPAVRIDASLGALALAGLVVGFGARLGSGCTSGHGVCGLARLSRRSIVAVATFMATAIATVALMNAAGIP
jgi:uncharacterized membrane protein YedE/YeeE